MSVAAPILETKEISEDIHSKYKKLTESFKKMITCPLSSKIMYEPIILECGHTFEEDSLRNVLVCPTCQQGVLKKIRNSAIKDMIAALIETEPTLAAEQYFTIDLFIKDVEEANKKNQPLPTHIRTLLLHQPAFFYQIHEKPYRGFSAFFYFTCPNADHTFLTEPNITKIVNRQTLNYIIKEGPCKSQSALLHLSCHAKGIAFLKKLDFNNMVTFEALNNIMEEGIMKGDNVIYRLTRDRESIELLAQLDKSMISYQALNSIIQRDGESAVLWLAYFSTRHQKSSAILAQLDAKSINPDTLNYIVTDGISKGESAVLWLAASPEGRRLLTELGLNKISPKTLNHLTPTGTSAIFMLAGSPEGLSLLAQLDLKTKIDINTLFAIIPTGPYKGESAYSRLASTDQGKKLLSEFNITFTHDLFRDSIKKALSCSSSHQKMNSAMLLTACGHSVDKNTQNLRHCPTCNVPIPASNGYQENYVVNSIIEIINKDSRTIKDNHGEELKHEHEDFHQKYQALRGAVTDAVSCPISLDIMDNPSLLTRCGHTFDLKNIVDLRPQLCPNGLRMQCCPSCNEVIQPNAYRPNYTIKTIINVINVDFNNYFNIDVLKLALQSTDEGVLKYLEYITYMLIHNKTGDQLYLNYIHQKAPYQGQSALFWLSSHPKGLALLAKPEIIKLISENTLNAVIPEGEFKGNSARTYLEASLEGRTFLKEFQKASAKPLLTQFNAAGAAPTSSISTPLSNKDTAISRQVKEETKTKDEKPVRKRRLRKRNK